MATRDEVAAVLYQMGTIYRDEIDDATVDAWVATVSDISGSDLVRAAGEHARESRFFPRPSELRARATALDLPSPEEAWLHVKEEIRRVGYCGEPKFSHPATEMAVCALGWETLCSMEIGNQAAERAHFMRIYGSYRETAQKAAQIGSVSPDVAGLVEHVLETPR